MTDTFTDVPRSRRLDGVDVQGETNEPELYQPNEVLHDEVDGGADISGAVIEIPDEDDPTIDNAPFDANLAEYLPPDVLDKLGEEIADGVEEDLRSRESWEKDIAKGLKLLGVKLEDISYPFKGACSATMPIIEENARAFQARALQALFPPEGPVHTRVYGKATDESDVAAGRVKAFMNWQLTEQMPEYFDDTDQLLYYLPLVGSAFRKVWKDDLLGRPSARFLKVDNFVVNYGAADLGTAERLTHIFTLSTSEYNRLCRSGRYMHVDLTPNEVKPTREIGDVVDDVTGQGQPQGSDSNPGIEFLEVCCRYNFDSPADEDDAIDLVDGSGVTLPVDAPYVVTLERESRKVVSVRRNWVEGDPFETPVVHYVHYKFMPGLGFYGQGYVQLLGNLQKTATTAMRSLVDAGQFANLQGGFKTRGLKIANDEGDVAIGFGEWVDVDVFGERLSDSIMPLPYKEPSQTLMALLTGMVEISRRLGAVVDVDSKSVGTNESPVGTTSMLLEQTMSQLGAVYQRLYRAQTDEFRILRRINSEQIDGSYPFPMDGKDGVVYSTDFATIQIMPVADPTAFSDAQRVVKAQAIAQVATQFPGEVDRPSAVRFMLKSLNLSTEDIDRLLPFRGEPPAMDPATEFYAILMGRPTKAYPAQNHMAHIAFLAAKKSDPGTAQAVGNPQAAQVLMARIDALIGQHMAYMQRQEIMAATGMQLPPAPDYAATDQADTGEYADMGQAAHNVAAAQAQAAQQLAKQRQQLAQAQKAQQAQQDPVFQLESKKADAAVVKAQADMIKAKTGESETQARVEVDTREAMHDAEIADREMARAERDTAARIENMARDNDRADRELQLEARRPAK